ncbi:MAG TPA: hypothetical protein VJA47_02725 [archaeon]|nr:hypothetical protein [archaeon]
MKYYFLLVLTIILISGCAQQANQDPTQLLKDSINKSSQASYKVDYDFIVDIGAFDELENFQTIRTIGSITQYKRGKNMKIVTKTDSLLTSEGLEKTNGTETIVYILPGVIYECALDNCTKTDVVNNSITDLLDQSKSLVTIDNAIKSGQVIVNLTQDGFVVGRQCFNFEISEGQYNNPYKMCMDKESGVTLSSYAETVLGSVISRINTTAKSFSTEVDDSEFVVPKN